MVIMSEKEKDIRWVQRFSNYQSALSQLKDAVKLYNKRELSLIEKQGMIQAFEFTHELAWKVLKDYLEYQSAIKIRGSRDAVRESFKIDLINDGQAWIEMIETRNNTSHTYDKEIAENTVIDIVEKYFSEFIGLEKEMISILNEQSN